MPTTPPPLKMPAIPVASDAMPAAPALDSDPGTGDEYARKDHTHAARIQRVSLVTAADGTGKWIYARPIVCPLGKVPPVTYMVEDTGTPVVVQVVSREFTRADGVDTHTSVTIRAQRSRALPATLISLAALTGFDIFGLAAGSTKVNLFAAPPTQ